MAVNLSPPIDPVAEHRVFTGAVAHAAVAPDAEPDVAALPGIGWPTFQASANAGGATPLFRRERLRDFVPVVDVLLVAVARGDRGVGECEDLILGRALAVVVDDGQLELRVGIALGRGLAPPVDCLRIVPRYTLALGVQQSQVVLRRRIALLGRFSEPRDGLHVVLLYAVAGRVDNSQFLFRVGVALRRCLADPRDALRLVLRIPVAELVHPPDPVLGFGVAAFRQRAIFVGGGDVVLLAQCLVAFLEAGDGGGGAQQD